MRKSIIKNLLKNHADKLRFLIVGSISTVIDFSILFLLTSFGMNKIVANFISTLVALIFSYFANKNFTFKASSENKSKQFLSFFATTAIGLWVIQPIIITAVSPLLSGYLSTRLNLLISKIIATAASMVWNYSLYKKFIFKKNKITE